MTSRRHLRLLALLLVPALATAQQPVEGGEEGDSASVVVESGTEHPGELENFRQTAARYNDRMREFETEARSIIDSREARDKESLRASYDALLTDLGEDEYRLRETAVARFEGFLRKYEDAPESASIMFRLAELYFEKSEEDYILADREYERISNDLMEAGDYDSIPAVPQKDFARSISLYNRILTSHPDYQFSDGAHYMLGYLYADTNAAQSNSKTALSHFQSLVSDYPDSQFASNAHLNIGEHYFEENDLDSAITHYRKVVELEGEEGKLYDKGLYKLAWSHYKQSNYGQALSLLNTLLDYSEETYQSTGQESAMAKEAVEYTAISFSDQADMSGEFPVNVAANFYEQNGDRPFESRVYKRLADVLIQQSRYEDAIATYEFIQSRWPEDPENPDFQWKVAELYNSLPVPDIDATNNAIVALNDRYNDQSDWWRANQTNPDALANARGYIEKSLSTVASNAHYQANQTGESADFNKAAGLYQQYLNEFPFADNYYQIQWYLADTLQQSGRFGEAEVQYGQLLKSADEHNFGAMSLYKQVLVRRQLVINLHGTTYELPSDAAVETVETLPSGKERNIYAIGEGHQSYLDGNDELMQIDFGEELIVLNQVIAETDDADNKENLELIAAELGQIEGILRTNQGAISYEIAQMMFNHGRYDEARERFFDIIAKWPDQMYANYSANLILDTYTAQEDLENLRIVSSRFALSPPGPPGEVDNSIFRNIEQKAAFKQAGAYSLQAIELRRDGDEASAREMRLKAAEEYLAYTQTYTEENDIYRKAFYNIGQNYAEAGNYDEANGYFRQYVDRFPGDELSFPLTFRIALNYASTLNLEEAVKYFEQLYDAAGKDYADAPTALYNAAFLRIGMNDYRGAAENFERYSREFPTISDAESVMFRAGAQWEKIDSTEAIRFYKRYLSNYQGTSPDRMMEAYNRIAELTEESGARARQVDAAWDDLTSAYLSYKDQIGPAGRHYAAHAEFRQVERVFETFKEINYTSNDTRNAELLIQQKPEDLAALEARCMAMITEYQDFEYSSAALFIAGLAYLTYSDMLYDAPPPKSLDEEEVDLYREAIDERRLPIEDKGKNRLSANLQKAADAHRWSPWMSRTKVELSRRFPGEYAPEKDEIRGMGDSNYVPGAGPISVRQDETAQEEGQQ
ncbi:MAG: tetratricopeptide repeat protein [Myxococcota bacterium]|nr:tetratricopeptide repeat protein [Myxococcota bacterium]